MKLLVVFFVLIVGWLGVSLYQVNFGNEEEEEVTRQPVRPPSQVKPSQPVAEYQADYRKREEAVSQAPFQISTLRAVIKGNYTGPMMKKVGDKEPTGEAKIKRDNATADVAAWMLQDSRKYCSGGLAAEVDAVLNDYRTWKADGGAKPDSKPIFKNTGPFAPKETDPEESRRNLEIMKKLFEEPAK